MKDEGVASERRAGGAERVKLDESGSRGARCDASGKPIPHSPFIGLGEDARVGGGRRERWQSEGQMPQCTPQGSSGTMSLSFLDINDVNAVFVILFGFYREKILFCRLASSFAVNCDVRGGSGQRSAARPWRFCGYVWA